MDVRRGDVVLVDWPFSDRTGSKLRPCLVVQYDENNARLADSIVSLITSRIQRASSEPTQLLIDITTTEGEATGLLFTSAVQAENLLTIDRSFIARRIGTSSTALMAKMDARLRQSLGLT